MKKIFLIIKEVINIIIFSIRKSFCSIGVHDYVYYTEKHKTTGIKGLNTININIRECATCEKRWKDTLTKGNGGWYEWKLTNLKKEDILHYEN